MLKAAELYAAEERTICRESEDTEIGYVFATAEVNPLKTLGGSCETGDDRIGGFSNACEVDCD